MFVLRDGGGRYETPARGLLARRRKMIPGRKYARHRLWKPEEEKQLREMAEAGKTITIIALRLKTNSHRCPRSIGYSQGLTAQGRATPKEKPDSVNRRA